MSDDINDYLPSILNPRSVKKNVVSLTQTSVISRCSLSLNRRKGLSARSVNKNVPVKKLFNQSQYSSCMPSTSGLTKTFNLNKTKYFSDSEELNKENNISDQNASVLTSKRPAFLTTNDLADASTLDLLSSEELPNDDAVNWDLKNLFRTGVNSKDKENESNFNFSIFRDPPEKINLFDENDVLIGGVEDEKSSKGVSTATELYTKPRKNNNSLDFSIFQDTPEKINPDVNISPKIDIDGTKSFKNGLLTQLNKNYDSLEYDLKASRVSISFGVTDCEFVDITAKNSNIKKISVARQDKDVNLECELAECLTLSTESEFDENMNETSPKSNKRAGVAVSLEIKKKKPSTEDARETSKLLILKTDAIKKLSHVIVQPPNYKLVKRHIFDRNKFPSGSKETVGQAENGKSKSARGDKLRQLSIDTFVAKDACRDRSGLDDGGSVISVSDDGSDMSKNLGETVVNSERVGRAARSDLKGHDLSPRSARTAAGRPGTASPKRQEFKVTSERTPLPRARNESASSHSPRKNDSVRFSLSSKSKTSRTPNSARNMPHYKIVAGTHFAVDAFSYGEIPNVKHYFLTHFHSDHYAGLKKSFNKLLYCSKITGDLCVSRLGVDPKYIHVLALDNATRIEGVEVTAVDANHCPGAVMLVFCLPNGKTILHTGDFRASPTMESYPLFWNKDIHTIYLDTTYCNPRYDFPTQDQSLEMALSLLRQKKMALEKNSKNFSSVLIVCGTYTIGKEKFFLGMARRVGCAVWACPEKDRVLQAVEGRSFGHARPHSCQLHVVPMRDLTHEKLKSYLDSLHGAFTEVVAFKPSGWENGKNSTVEKDNVTIHGIPYSEHSSFSELIRFVKFLKPKQVVPTVDISGGTKAVQKYFPCPLVYKEDTTNQSRVTDYFSIQGRQQASAVT